MWGLCEPNAAGATVGSQAARSGELIVRVLVLGLGRAGLAVVARPSSLLWPHGGAFPAVIRRPSVLQALDGAGDLNAVECGQHIDHELALTRLVTGFARGVTQREIHERGPRRVDGGGD